MSMIFRRNYRTTCVDGTSLSIQTGSGMYCIPREDNAKEYTAVEVGFIADANDNPVTPPDEWKQYSDGSFPSDVYGYVPVEIVERFIASHGGRKAYPGIDIQVTR